MATKELTSEFKRDLGRLFNKRINAFEEAYSKHHENMKRWRRLYEEGENFTGDLAGRMYDFKLVWSIIEGLVPSLVITDPDIVLDAQKVDNTGRLETAEAVINYYWKEKRVKKELKQAIRNALVEGFGVIKVGWKVRERHTKRVPEEMNQTDIGGQETFTPDELEVDEDLFVKRVNPLLFRWDPHAPNLRDARWLGEKIIQPLEAVKRNENFNPQVREKVNGSGVGFQEAIREQQGQSKIAGDAPVSNIDQSPDRFATLYEIHDKERNLLLTLADGVDEPLRVVEYPYDQIENSHYDLLKVKELEDRIEGKSTVNLIENQQSLVNEVRSLKAEHVRRMVPKIVVSRSSEIQNEDIVKLTSARANTVVQIDGQAADVQQIQPSPIPADHYNVADLAESDMKKISGTPPSRFGQAQGGRTSATEVKEIEQNEQFRIENSRAEIEDFAADLSAKMLQVLNEKLPEDKTFSITGPDRFTPLNFTKEEIKGQFAFRVVAGSMARPDRQAERQQLLDLAKIMTDIPGFDKQELAKEIIDTFPTIKNKDKFFKTRPQVERSQPNFEEEARPSGAPDVTAQTANNETRSRTQQPSPSGQRGE